MTKRTERTMVGGRMKDRVWTLESEKDVDQNDVIKSEIIRSLDEHDVGDEQTMNTIADDIINRLMLSKVFGKGTDFPIED